MDITDDVMAFRDAARSVWNLLMLPYVKTPDVAAAWEDWEEICRYLFNSLVSHKHDIDVPLGSRLGVFFDSLIVKCPRGAEILVNRDIDSSGYWDFDFRGDIERLHMSWGWFFDFECFGRVDFNYHHVLITADEVGCGVVGRRALVGVRDSRIILARCGS